MFRNYSVNLKLVASAILLVSCHGLWARDYHISIDEIEPLAEKQSLMLKAKKSDVLIAASQITTAGLWSNPEFGIQYDYAALTPNVANNPRTFDLHLTQPFKAFGVRGARIDQARAATLNTYLRTADFRRTFFLQARLSAYKLIILQTAMAFQQAFYENYQKLLQANNFRYKKGDISEYELKKLEVEGTRYENSMVGLRVDITKGTNELKKMLSIHEEDTLQIADTLREPNSDKIMALLEGRNDLENRADMLASRNEIAVAERTLNVVKKESLPEFSASALYHYEPSQPLFANNHYFGVGVTLPLKIFDRNQGQKEAYTHLVEQKRAEYEQDMLAARAEIAAQKIAIKQYLNVLVRGKTRLQLSREVYEKGRLLYTKKASGLIQLLESERSYFEFQRDYFALLYNFQESLEIYLALAKTLSEKERQTP